MQDSRETNITAGVEQQLLRELPSDLNIEGFMSNEALLLEQKGQARNAPCACGSGIKWKRCCRPGIVDLGNDVRNARYLRRQAAEQDRKRATLLRTAQAVGLIAAGLS